LAKSLVLAREVLPSEIQQLYSDPWAMYTLRRRVFAAAVAPLNLADDSFQNASPFDPAESIGTIGAATGGTPPYQYSILSQTLL